MLKSKMLMIKDEYNSFYDDLLIKGRLPMKDTGIGFWGAANADEVFQAFKELNLQRCKSFVDLGSGDGKVVLIASLFTRAAGIEHDTELHEKALELKDKLHLKAEFMNSDFMMHDISGYDAVFLHPDKPLRRGIEHKLIKELNGKLIHYGNHFHPTTLKLEQQMDVNGTLVSVYSRA